MVTFKDVMKTIENILIVFCAVFISTIFLNYRLDLSSVGNLATNPITAAIYEGQLSMSTMMVVLCAGVLGSLAVLMLIFSVGKFVDKNKANMGVMKALGYGNIQIAVNFIKFGLSVFTGATLGCGAGYAFSPFFYSIMSEDMFAVDISFHIEILIFSVVVPTILFSLIAFVSALIKLRKPPLAMINGVKSDKFGRINAAWQKKVVKVAFPKALKRSMLLSSLLLIFFVGFASFAFSSELQIAFSVQELGASTFFSVLMVVLAFVMGGSMLLLSFRFIFNSHNKYVSLMKAYGYSVSECRNSLFGGYRIVSYIGFAIGTVYQYFIVSIMMSFFGDAYNLEVKFSVIGFFVTLAAFIVCYEAVMYFYLRRINRLPLGRVMQS